MKKVFIKLFSFAVVICIAFSVVLPTFAEDANIIPQEELTETVTADEAASSESDTDIESTDEDDTGEDEPAEEGTIRMYLCATAHSFTGHVWLYFENNTGEDLPLGYATLKAGSKMTVGSLRNTRKNHGGTYYNGEAFMVKDAQTLKEHTTSIGMELTRKQLETVSEKIRSQNLYILIGWNCGNFACRVWNSVSDRHILHIAFPVFTVLSMRAHGAVKGEILLEKPDISEVFKQTKDGIIQADEKSFRVSCIG